MELSKLVKEIYVDKRSLFRNKGLMYEQCILPELFKNYHFKQRFLAIMNEIKQDKEFSRVFVRKPADVSITEQRSTKRSIVLDDTSFHLLNNTRKTVADMICFLLDKSKNKTFRAYISVKMGNTFSLSNIHINKYVIPDDAHCPFLERFGLNKTHFDMVFNNYKVSKDKNCYNHINRRFTNFSTRTYKQIRQNCHNLFVESNCKDELMILVHAKDVLDTEPSVFYSNMWIPTLDDIYKIDIFYGGKSGCAKSVLINIHVHNNEYFDYFQIQFRNRQKGVYADSMMLYPKLKTKD